MTKQEEILKRTAKWLFDSEMSASSYGKETRRKAWRRERKLYLAKAYNLLHALDREEVVIKVERELPIIHWCELCESYETGTDPFDGDWATCNNQECKAGARKWRLKAGYVAVEPLIKEKK